MKFSGKKVRIIVLIASLVAFTVLTAFLISFTKQINERKKAEQLKDQLKTIIEECGEQGLLEIAGVDVNNIMYSEDGLTILEGDTSSWLYSSDELINTKVYRQCSPAVVHISTVATDLSSFLDVQPENGSGSGFFVSSDGYICTNEHVIENADEITVTTYDGNVYDAILVGTDKENDIAVIKIDSKNGESFKYLEFTTSDSLFVGQKVLAIGNPFGYDRTLTSGIISGLSRPIRNSEGQVLLGMIQTDASINPGNSGGPLLDIHGNVIGVCAAVYSESDNSNGLGFAVSSKDAMNSVSDIIKYGKVKRGWIDIVPVVLTPEIVKYASLKVDNGILVSQTVSGGKAEMAGLRGGTKQVMYGNSSVIFLGGDVITSINGTDIKDFTDLFTALSSTRPGDKATVTVDRNGSKVNLTIELVERTAELVSYTNR